MHSYAGGFSSPFELDRYLTKSDFYQRAKRNSIIQHHHENYKNQSPFRKRFLSQIDRKSEITEVTSPNNKDPWSLHYNSTSKFRQAATKLTLSKEPLKVKVNERIEPEYDVGHLTVPQYIRVTSRFEDNSIECVRKQLRVQSIDHSKFNVFYTTKEGQKSFNGVYEPNNPMHVLENPAAVDEPRNYYAFIAKHPPQLNKTHLPIV